jgi:PhnB protein
MTILLNPYLNFRDDAREAMEFYQSVFGGELELMPFSTVGASDDPAEADKIMHGYLRTPGGIALMGADTPNSMEYSPVAGMSVSLSGPAEDGDELRRYWTALSEGGTVTVPLETAPWGDTFGMCVDRFGIPWMVNIAGQPS